MAASTSSCLGAGQPTKRPDRQAQAPWASSLRFVPVPKGRRVSPARLFRPGGVRQLADATSIGGIAVLASTKNPSLALSRRPFGTGSYR